MIVDKEFINNEIESLYLCIEQAKIAMRKERGKIRRYELDIKQCRRELKK